MTPFDRRKTNASAIARPESKSAEDSQALTFIKPEFCPFLKTTQQKSQLFQFQFVKENNSESKDFFCAEFCNARP